VAERVGFEATISGTNFDLFEARPRSDRIRPPDGLFKRSLKTATVQFRRGWRVESDHPDNAKRSASAVLRKIGGSVVRHGRSRRPPAGTWQRDLPVAAAVGHLPSRAGDGREKLRLDRWCTNRGSPSFADAYSTNIRRFFQGDAKSLKLLAFPRGIEPLFQPTSPSATKRDRTQMNPQQNHRS
jgi:hypothetical protein